MSLGPKACSAPAATSSVSVMSTLSLIFWKVTCVAGIGMQGRPCSGTDSCCQQVSHRVRISKEMCWWELALWSSSFWSKDI